MSYAPLDTGGQVATAAVDDPNKTIVFPTSSNAEAATDGKLVMRRHKREGKIAQIVPV